MNVSIPVLVVEQKQLNSSLALQTVRPLFFPQMIEQAESLPRALNKLSNNLRQQIETLGKEARHDRVAEICFAPPLLDSKIVDLRLNLGAENFDCRYLFVRLAGFGKRLVLTPNVPDLWFELEKGEDLKMRAAEVLDEYFRRLERVAGRGSQNPSAYNFAGKTWLSTIDFDVSLAQKFEPPTENFFAFLGMAEKMSGAEELRKTGRNLDALYPSELERTAGRESELAKLTELLDSNDQRPVLLVGKNSVGKTALVHEYIFRQIEKRRNPRSGERNTWLLAPQRLISGMMYVGQWEERLLAIIKEAGAKKHLLYFEDLLGLFFAGQSRDSDLSMAQVIKPFVEKREVRILAETTAEGLRILRERDRSFADLFQVLRLAETDDNETLRITLSVRRALEQKYNCRFALDALPVALDLERRYNREAAFPGKVARFLTKLAIKFRGNEIVRANVLAEFESSSGMSVAFLDDRAKLDRAEIIKQISGGIVGQTTAVEAIADVLSVAKARLNDAARPLASFLFVGATGVGKTEAAKQIAAYLYGDANKLLRFDMNEFISSFDAARLVGTFEQPEGLLTSAIRRQPFAIVLLDEIEKAHPDVFNLLLQVMGDGRLTDALGRTADFTNAIVLLTSNLGAREANAKPGFRQTNEIESNVYRQAAAKFFRPEFFNRLDRVIGFERLQKREVEQIARLQLEKVFARDGFVRRNCKLNVSPEAMELIVSEGYHPQLGARALKRSIEKFLTAPVAAELSALPPEAPVIIYIKEQNKKIAASVEEIKPAALRRSYWLSHDFTDLNQELDLIADALDRAEDKIEFLKPAGEINPNDAGQSRYFLVREQIKRIERMIEKAEKWQIRELTEVQSSKSKSQSSTARARSARQLVSLLNSEIDFAQILVQPNIGFGLKQLAAENRIFGERIEDYLQDIWRETALLKILIENLTITDDAQTILTIHINESKNIAAGNQLLDLYVKVLEAENGLRIQSHVSCIDQPDLQKSNSLNSKIVLTGCFARALMRAEIGKHIFIRFGEGFTALDVSLKSNLTETLNQKHFSEEIAPAETNLVRVYDGRGTDLRYALDFRSGLITKDVLTERELRTFLLSGLPAPSELG